MDIFFQKSQFIALYGILTLSDLKQTAF